MSDKALAELGIVPAGDRVKLRAFCQTVAAYPSMFFNMFTDANKGEVAAQTTMGIQADDPTDPSELGKAAKRFFLDGTNATMRKENTSKKQV